MGTLSRAPQNATAFFDRHHYYFERPQEVYGPNAPVPPPPTAPDMELAEQVLGVFDNVIYNESGGGNDGGIVVTQL